MREPATCPVCGVEEGQLHKCDMAQTDVDGRLLPYIDYPTYCAKCGAKRPSLFMVPNEVWAYYVEPRIRDLVVCRQCFDFIRQAVDAYQGPPPFGDFEIQTQRQLFAARYERMIGLAEEASQVETEEIVREIARETAARLRAEAEEMDRQLARDEGES